MSSADVRPRGAFRAGLVLGVLVLVLQLAVLVALPFAVRPLAGALPAPVPGGSGAPVGPGTDGVGDPYFPDYGAGGYDAQRYAVDVSWNPADARLTGRTVVTARATQPLTGFSLDLALAVSAVRVDGRPATFRTDGFQDLRITPASTIPAGATFRVEVEYGGRPATISRDGIRPFSITGDEVLVAGEPESSAWWFPANDHPSDPALMDVTARVPTGWQAVSTGALAAHTADPVRGQDVWHWVSDRPSATYLSFLALGRFELRQGTADGRPYVYAVSRRLSAGERRRAFVQLERTPQVIRVLEGLFGPYPFGQIGGLVPAARLWFDGLETQTRPVYAAGAMTRGDAGELLSHELSHMWFGDNVTLAQWNDIFDNEAWASWGAWAYRERTGGPTAEQQFLELYGRAEDSTRFWRVGLLDPGRDHLFDVVYLRGPMTLQALRNRMGDAAFLAMARDWAQTPGTRSLENWMVTTQHAADRSGSGVDLTSFFQAWLVTPAAPARTVANGFPR